MLAVTSDWGLSDGSLCPSRAGRALVWLEAIRLAVARSGWRDDGRYRPVASATLVFAGDTFDWLLSDAWSGPLRPWRAGREAAAARSRVAAATIRAAMPVLRTLRRWTRAGLAIPAADRLGRPAPRCPASAAVLPILLAGDRDWWLPEAIGAASRFGCLIGEEWSDGTRWVRHGHDLDPTAHAAVPVTDGRDRPPSLAESLAVDLLVPFAVAARLEGDLWTLVRPLLGRLAAVRPAAFPRRISGMLDVASAQGGDDTRDRLQSLWRASVATWHARARREVPAYEAEFDVVDELAAWLDRLDAAADTPATVARLDRTAAAAERPPAIRPSALDADAPVLLVVREDGGERRLPLAAASPGTAIVVVGGGGAGTGFVDAA